MRSAEHHFLERGVEQTTIEDITRDAAVSKGAFYLHFSSKADVVEALRLRFVQSLLDGINSEVAQQDDGNWNGKLGAWAKACSTGYLNASRLHDLIFAAAPPPAREGLTSNMLIDNLTELLIAGNHANAWALETPEFTAVFLFNALHGVVNQSRIARSDAERLELLHDVDGHFQRLVGRAE